MGAFDHLKLRRGTEAEWTSENPILEEGEPAFSTDTGDLRIGNGTDHWADLDSIGGGVTDHGALTGLADDDHPQYTTAAEAGTIADASVSTHAGLADPHPGYLTPAEGNAAYDAAGAAAAGDASHVGAGDPHTQYQTEAAHTKALHDGLALSHDSLSDVSIDDHHARDHALNASVHTGTLDDAQIPASIARDSEVTSAIATHAGIENAHDLEHSDLNSIGADDHHAKVHTHVSAGEGGTVSHDDLTGVSIDDHHARDHASTHGPAAADALKLDDLAAPDDNTDLDVSTSKHGLAPKAPNDTSKYLRGDATWAVRKGRPYGTGADGAAVLDGTQLVPWATLSGTTYSMFRNAECTTITLSAGITLKPLGCQIFATTSIDISGTISFDGGAASSNTAGSGPSTATGAKFGGTATGAAGRVNTASVGVDAATGGTNQTASSGRGGAGGCGTAIQGGSGGGNSFPSATYGGPGQWDMGVLGGPWGGNGDVKAGPQGGTGGGGGAGAASGTSGGGGAGGGVISIAAKTITVQTGGLISADGGAGGNASGTGPVGGGGGGGGGVIYLEYDVYTNSGTVRCAGGAGGTASGTPTVTSGAAPGEAGNASDTDARYYSLSISPPQTGCFVLLAVVNTKSGGGDIPTSVAFTTQTNGGAGMAMENGTLTQVDTVVNGDMRMTLYWGRYTGFSSEGHCLIAFPATQTSCGAQLASGPYGYTTANAVQQSKTGTSSASTTLSLTMGTTTSSQSYTYGFFAVQANVTITAGAGYTGQTARAFTAPAGQLRSEYQRGFNGTTVNATTAANQTWVGIAVEIRTTGAGEAGFAGRVVQIPSQ